jgi:hypothetical protein
MTPGEKVETDTEGDGETYREDKAELTDKASERNDTKEKSESDMTPEAKSEVGKSGNITGDTELEDTKAESDDKLADELSGNDASEDTPETEQATGSIVEEDSGILSYEEDADFDDSLLDAEPLYEFDYKGRHIATYLTYSLIFDGDNVTKRNMQLFVKNGQLFAINAPDDIVPGCVMIDSYQGSNYMSVLSKNGSIVDLMDTLNYPEDFKNYDIKAISSNLYSDLAYLQVEYNDGAIIAFNYLTGTVIYEQEAEDTGDGSEITGSLSEFISYITGFFRRTFDTAYSEVTNAYQNALSLKDYLTGSAWSSYLGKGATADGSGEEDDELVTSLDSSKGTASPEGGKSLDDADDITYGSLDEATGDGITDKDASDGSDREEDNDITAIETDDDIDAAFAASQGGDKAGINGTYGAVSDDELDAGIAADGTGSGSGSGAMLPDESGSAVAADGESADGAGGMISDGTGAGSADDATADETADDDKSGSTGAGSADDATAEEAADTDEDETSQSDDTADDELSDDLIIAYDGDNGSYAIYSEDELLGSDESVTSVDKRMEDYLAAGGTAETYEKEFSNLSVSGSQKNGIYIILITGTAIGGMLIILIVQKTKRRTRKSDKFRRHR